MESREEIAARVGTLTAIFGGFFLGLSAMTARDSTLMWSFGLAGFALMLGGVYLVATAVAGLVNR